MSLFEELTVTAREKNKKGLDVSSSTLTFSEDSHRQYSVMLTSKPEGDDVRVALNVAVDDVITVYDKKKDALLEMEALQELVFTDGNWNGGADRIRLWRR